MRRTSANVGGLMRRTTSFAKDTSPTHGDLISPPSQLPPHSSPSPISRRRDPSTQTQTQTTAQTHRQTDGSIVADQETDDGDREQEDDSDGQDENPQQRKIIHRQGLALGSSLASGHIVDPHIESSFAAAEQISARMPRISSGSMLGPLMRRSNSNTGISLSHTASFPTYASSTSSSALTSMSTSYSSAAYSMPTIPVATGNSFYGAESADDEATEGEQSPLLTPKRMIPGLQAENAMKSLAKNPLSFAKRISSLSIQYFLGDFLAEVAEDSYTANFILVYAKELQYIQRRRDRHDLDSKSIAKKSDALYSIPVNTKKIQHAYSYFIRMLNAGPEVELVGLALSGGGVRSATFNLGLLQAMSHLGILRYVDYVSTVSGGGYTGCCMTAMLQNPKASVHENSFPLKHQCSTQVSEGEQVTHIRQYCNYLLPDRRYFGHAFFSMVTTYITGLILTNVVPFSIMLILCYGIHLFREHQNIVSLAVVWLLRASVLSFYAMVFIRFWSSLLNLNNIWRKRHDVALSMLGMTFVGCTASAILIMAIPQRSQDVEFFTDFDYLIILTVIAIVGFIQGIFAQKVTNKILRGISQGLFIIATFSFLPLLFSLTLLLLEQLNAFDLMIYYIPAPLFVALHLLFLSMFINTNRISLHSFYADRLTDSFLTRRYLRKSLQNQSPENTLLCEIHQNSNSPYHIINATLNFPESKNEVVRGQQRGRGEDVFIFTKHFCGSESTGYRATESFESGKLRLATAMAISGAAASPQMGTSTSPVITFLFTLLNVRLNYWITNPRLNHSPLLYFWPYYFVRELFGKGKETDRLLNLSDGGHFENLGVYSLIKRGCKYIFASDAGEDLSYTHEDLAVVIRKVRIDLGVEIKIDLSSFRPANVNRISENHGTHANPGTTANSQSSNNGASSSTHFAIGHIYYPNGTMGYLIFFKPTIIPLLPEDVQSYARMNANFPNEPTTDQFFEEAQFESYRKLGETIGLNVFTQHQVRVILSSMVSSALAVRKKEDA
eukprot:TRINITY_DN9283_c0_g1_i1.p1 TRINITY_DN9283_c0_g1~~TRINITY_DN9283_c0_g1_i1.p1  ORF type:complete len:1009 (+),score=195.69 TRINITY_DN9283_c0_g1_i1:43-3069(+)